MTATKSIAICALLYLALAPVSPRPAVAEMVTWNFEGFVTTVHLDPTGIFAEGQLLAGSVTFDSLTPPNEPIGIATYTDPITSVGISLGPYVAGGGIQTSFIQVQEQIAYSLRADEPPGATLPGGWTPRDFQIRLDGQGIVPSLPNARPLPTTPPDLTEFTHTGRFSLAFVNAPRTSSFFVAGDLTSLTGPPTVIPIPAALPLLLSALGALVFARRR